MADNDQNNDKLDKVMGRLDDIERIVCGVVRYLDDKDKKETEEQGVKQEEINKEDFAKLYNAVKYSIPLQTRFAPLVIYFNEKYKDSIIRDLVYPSDFKDLYQPKAEISPVLIGFKPLKYDYSVDFVLEGFFEWDK